MSKAISSVTPTVIKSFYPSNTFLKGKEYYAAQRVVNVRISNASAIESHIHAKVQGTKLYTVSIRVRVSKHSIDVYDDCSCPMMHTCKHSVATLLQAIDKHAGTKTDIVEDPRVSHWLSELQSAMTESSNGPAPVDESYGLYYVLSKVAGGSHQLGVEPLLIRHLKAGGLGASKHYSATA